MFDLQQTAEADGRASEAKVWSVLIAQIWTGLPGYCYGSSDLQQVMTIPHGCIFEAKCMLGVNTVIFPIVIAASL
jgi:hypothetical protein